VTAEKPRRLGRGLEALLAVTPSGKAEPKGGRDALRQLPIAQIRANPYQPRKEFSAEELADLEASLRATGLLQPITVRTAPDGKGYELIAGERRLRAASRLGWTEIASVVREIDDRTLLTLALVENLQRTDLNPLEEAEGYRRLMDEFGLTQQQIADVIGKDRTTIANMLRVLNLPATVRRMLQTGQITLGHARPLLALGDERAMLDLAREIVGQGLSVREVERRVREATPDREEPKKRAAPAARSAQVRLIEDQFRRRLQTDVRLTLSGPERGELRIQFYSSDDLERLRELILGAETDSV
jgi:ParB family transcriptional regulator, chromosome partitioning protein